MITSKKILFQYLLVLFCLACKHPHTNSEIETAMKQYNHLIQKMDVDSISLMYTSDGNLGGVAMGRDSIKIFLQRFKNVKVLSQNSLTDSINFHGDSCTQKGIYNQICVINEKDTVTVKGKFIADWIWNKNEGWKIRKMITSPLK